MALVTVTTITLEAHNGRYVVVGEGGQLSASSESVSPEGKFRLVEFGANDLNNNLNLDDKLNNILALKASNDSYVSVKLNNRCELIANVGGIGAWEKLKVISLGNGKIALQASNGKYVCADGEGEKLLLVANRGVIGPWETFMLKKSYLAESKEYWYDSPDTHPAIQYAQVAVSIVFDIAQIPGGSIVGLCFDLMIPEESRLTVKDVRGIALNEVAQDNRRDLMDELKTHKTNWEDIKYLKKSGRIANYFSELRSIQKNVLASVNKSIELSEPDYKTYENTSSIEILLYSFECFGMLSLLDLTLIQESIAVLERQGISEELITRNEDKSFYLDLEARDEDKNCYMRLLNSRTNNYKAYAQSASSKIIEDRLRYISPVDDAVSSWLFEGNADGDIMQFFDRYYQNDCKTPIYQMKYFAGGPVIFHPNDSKPKVRRRVQAKRDAYIDIVKAQLEREHMEKVPILSIKG
jgi:hypothetical protein